MPTTVRKTYILPATVVRAGVVAMVISVVVNFAGAYFYVFPQTKSTSLAIDEQPFRLPIDLHEVALEVVDTAHYGMHDDNDWASVIPIGHGFVRMGGASQKAYYAVSMYHQMHCLNSFRKMFNGRNASRVDHDAAHALHCLTYLRQMVLCSADVTLELAFAARNVDGRKTQAVYGTGVTHECRDWVQVRQFVESNYEEWKDDDNDYAVTEASATVE